ncbi:MAG: hypothetical protein H6617_11315 [Bdellovibrionaceae bacterium]|nr:hypothetical protein [Bdellovibrionales bacterium]MCB9255261.1 hypothetical protein [Pseudobdellovibrionaceae bacterium]
MKFLAFAALAVVMALPGMAAEKKEKKKEVGSVTVPMSESTKLEKDRAVFSVTLNALCFLDEDAAVDALNNLKKSVTDELRKLEDSNRGDELNIPGPTALGAQTLEKTVIVEKRAQSVDDEQCTNVGVAFETLSIDTGAPAKDVAAAIDFVRAKSGELQEELRKGRKEGEERKRRLALSFRPPVFYVSDKSINEAADKLKSKIEEEKDKTIAAEVALANGGKWWISSPGAWSVSGPQKPRSPRGDFGGRELAKAAAFESAPTEIEVASGNVVVSRTFSVGYIANKKN